jgi:general stress protein YciG
MAKSLRGLASASKQTRRDVGQKGGKAHHTKRGLQAADQQTRQRVARLGGKA